MHKSIRIRDNTIYRRINTLSNNNLNSHRKDYNPTMNILKDLLFLRKWHISRADFIYWLSFNILLFLVSINAFTSWQSIRLIGWWYDMIQWIISLISIVWICVSCYSYYTVVSKRFRTLSYSPSITILAILVPPITLLWLAHDPQHITFHHRWMSATDRILFYILLSFVLICIYTFFEVQTTYKIVLTLWVLTWFLFLGFFSYDNNWIQSKDKKWYQGIDVYIDLVFLLLIVFFIRIYLITPFQIIGPSMESTFHGWTEILRNRKRVTTDGEYILVDKMTYRFSEPERGDVVVFTPWVGPKKRYLIKRIIGIPGDRIKIENWYVYIAEKNNPENYIQIDESPYLDEKYGYTCVSYNDIDCKNDNHVFNVPVWSYFLLWDNRLKSLDARKCFNNQGCTDIVMDAQFTPRSRILGRVSFSLGHFDILSQILPYPKMGTFQWIFPFRGFEIQNFHTYTDLIQ